MRSLIVIACYLSFGLSLGLILFPFLHQSVRPPLLALLFLNSAWRLHEICQSISTLPEKDYCLQRVQLLTIPDAVML